MARVVAPRGKAAPPKPRVPKPGKKATPVKKGLPSQAELDKVLGKNSK